MNDCLECLWSRDDYDDVVVCPFVRRECVFVSLYLCTACLLPVLLITILAPITQLVNMFVRTYVYIHVGIEVAFENSTSMYSNIQLYTILHPFHDSCMYRTYVRSNVERHSSFRQIEYITKVIAVVF